MNIRALLLAGSCMTALAAPGLATAADDDSIAELIVTAQKREQRLLDVPVAIQAISGEQLENQGDRQINDLIQSIPGASSVSRTAPGFETIQIRGISSGTTGDATVGYYIDDVAFGVPNLQLAPPARLFDLQRAEILRGPQGTLYGQGAMGGTIRLITKAPDTNEFAARAQGEVSSTSGGADGYAFDAVVNVPLMQDRAGLRITGGYEDFAGFAESPEFPGEKDINGGKTWNIRGKLLVNFTDNLDVTLTAWRVDNEMDFSNTLTTAKPPILRGTGGTRGFIKTDANYLTTMINWRLPGAILTSATGYVDHTLDLLAGSSAIIVNDSIFRTHQVNQEFRLTSDSDSPFKWITGAYYNHAIIDSDIFLTVNRAPLINSTGKVNTMAWAVFGEVSYDLMEGKLVPLFGLRYFEDRREVSGIDRNTRVIRDQGANFDSLNPRFNLTYKPNDNVMVYGNVAKGFRSGAIQTPGSVAAAARDNVPTDIGVDPDKVWSYEVGTKARLLDGALIVDASVYRMDWKGIQLQFTTTAGIIALANGGDAKIEGVDLGLTWRPGIEGLQLSLVGNVNEAEFKTVAAAIARAVRQVKPGQRIPNVPEHNVTLAVDYQRALETWDVTGFFNTSLAYVGTQIDAASGLRTGQIRNLAFNLGVRRENWRAAIFGENLLDQEVAVVRTATTQQPIYPRRLGIRLSADF
ncbi:MAG: TonB-dependent receptor [Phenylobacterium sp.]|jgi:outer membrane receptor protein involved in Fe transport